LVVRSPNQGEIWWAETEDAGRRPVLVVSRTAATERLRRIVVAPITRTIRGIPTEIKLGSEQGLSQDCVASFDNMMTITTALLVDRAGMLGVAGRHEVCEALAALADC